MTAGIPLVGQTIAPLHCSIKNVNGQVTIEAIEGAVTFVNGRRITEVTPLKQVPPPTLRLLPPQSRLARAQTRPSCAAHTLLPPQGGGACPSCGGGGTSGGGVRWSRWRGVPRIVHRAHHQHAHVHVLDAGAGGAVRDGDDGTAARASEWGDRLVYGRATASCWAPRTCSGSTTLSSRRGFASSARSTSWSTRQRRSPTRPSSTGTMPRRRCASPLSPPSPPPTAASACNVSPEQHPRVRLLSVSRFSVRSVRVAQVADFAVRKLCGAVCGGGASAARV